MKLRFAHSLPTGGTLYFSVTQIASRVSDRAVICEVSQRVRKLPFPPWDGKRHVYIAPEVAVRAHAAWRAAHPFVESARTGTEKGA